MPAEKSGGQKVGRPKSRRRAAGCQPKVRRQKSTIWCPIRLRIPLVKVAFQGAADGYRGRLRVFVSDRDGNGYLSPVRVSAVPIAVPGSELEVARSKDYLYEVKMLWAPGGRRVAIGVHDELAAVASFMTEDVLVFPR